MSNKVNNAKGIYLRGIRDGEIKEVLENYMGETYTQHSTGVKDEKAGFKAFFEDFFLRHPKRDIQVVRVIEDGDYVFLHVHQNLNDGEAQWVTTDIFKANADGKIIEHWDVIDVFLNERPDMIYGDFKVTDLHLGNDNKKIIRRFLTDIYQNQDFAQWDHYVDQNLIQHNPNIEQGSNAYLKYSQNVHYDFVFKVLSQGNYVIAYSKVVIKGQEYALMDIFRLENSKIVEHWDNKELMPNKYELTNLGKF